MKSIISSLATIFFLILISPPLFNAEIITDSVTSRLINATADQVWLRVEDFCNVYLYAPLEVSFCTKGVPNEPGLIRYIALFGQPPTGENTTIVLWEKHLLTAISPQNRSLELVLLDTNRGIKYFSPRQQVLENGGGSVIYWTYRVDLGDVLTREQFLFIITTVIDVMVGNIEEAVASSEGNLVSIVQSSSVGVGDDRLDLAQ